MRLLYAICSGSRRCWRPCLLSLIVSRQKAIKRRWQTNLMLKKRLKYALYMLPPMFALSRVVASSDVFRFAVVKNITKFFTKVQRPIKIELVHVIPFCFARFRALVSASGESCRRLLFAIFERFISVFDSLFSSFPCNACMVLFTKLIT